MCVCCVWFLKSSFLSALGVSFTAVRKRGLGHITIGDIISYVCSPDEQTGLPLNAVICKKRSDLEWDDVLKNSIQKLYSKKQNVKNVT